MILALYLRLSKEDGDLVDESNSITNQRFILHNYIENKPEFEGLEVREYTDDGYTGKNFERPGMMRLLEAVKSGKIYGIIVKDLSRFGRNHIEVGDYIEKIFPLLDIRFISVNNQFDSAEYVGTTPDMDVTFENLMYDYFSEENSVKIKNDLRQKRRRGKFVAAHAPFGYMKSPQDHNQLVVDEETAQIVRLVFEKYIESGATADVARYLNSNDIPTPKEYMIQKGVIKRPAYEKEKKFWTSPIIRKILCNPIYIGNIQFHKFEVLEVGSKRYKCIPKSEWETCEGTHEGLVTKELFETANRMLSERGKTKKKLSAEKTLDYDTEKYCEGIKRRRGSKSSPIKGLIKCGGCKHTMTRRSRYHASYYCSYYYNVKLPGCCTQNVKEADLLEIVKSAICEQAILAADLKKILKLYRDMIKKEQDRIKREIMVLQNRAQSYKDNNFSLYEKYKKGEIEQSEFQELRQKNLKAVEACESQIDNYKENADSGEIGDKGLFALLEGKEQITELTREMVEQLISGIYVYDGNRVEIIFKFKDEMEKLLEITQSDKMQKIV